MMLRDLENKFKCSKLNDFYTKNKLKIHSALLSSATACSLLTVSASAEGGADYVAQSVSTWSTIISETWNVIVANPILLAYAGAGFLFIGSRLFKAFK